MEVHVLGCYHCSRIYPDPATFGGNCGNCVGRGYTALIECCRGSGIGSVDRIFCEIALRHMVTAGNALCGGGALAVAEEDLRVERRLWDR